MGLREDLLKRIDKKNEEMREMETQVRELNCYIQGLQDVLKLIPRDSPDEGGVEHTLRANSDIAKAREFLEEIGNPAHVSEILVGIGKGNTKANRLSLSGSLGEYVRSGRVFSRPGPNTFGLLKFGARALPYSADGEKGAHQSSNKKIKSPGLEPPEDFGTTTGGKTDFGSQDDPFTDETFKDDDPFKDE